MEVVAAPQREVGLKKRRIAIILRGSVHRRLEGTIHAAVGQPVVVFFATRKTLVNLTEVDWDGSGSPQVPHLALRAEGILWVRSQDQAMPLTLAMGAMAPRRVRCFLENGMVLEGTLPLAPKQRLSDYFDTARAFIPLLHAKDIADDEDVGDIALNRDAVLGIQDA